MLNTMTTGRDSQNFSNPNLFDPDRWDKKTSEDNLTFTSLPFGFGPRMCYGEYTHDMEEEGPCVIVIVHYCMSF